MREIYMTYTIRINRFISYIINGNLSPNQIPSASQNHLLKVSAPSYLR